MSRLARHFAALCCCLAITACAGDPGEDLPGPDGSPGSADALTTAGDGGGDPGHADGAMTDGGLAAADGGTTGDPGLSDAVWATDPCATPNAPPPGYQLVTLDDGDNTLNLSDNPGTQMIVAGPGHDTIYAGPGNDIICAGPGQDLVYGQEGDDYIDGGYANDELHGNNGNDIIHGRAGSDTIYGEGGWDTLAGDILDDRIFGGDGNDLLIGGHGTDFMHGGKNDDWLRGDTNGDELVGGAGTDVASFITATPPGQPGFGPNPPAGIDADVTLAAGQHCAGKDPSDLSHDIDYPGCAWGDGRDGLMGIEVIVGSPFDDEIAGGPGVNRFYGGYGNDTFRDLEAGDEVVGGPGKDVCDGTTCDEAGEGAVTYPLVYVDARARDLGVVFIGGDGDDAVTFSRSGDGVMVTETAGRALATGNLCRHPGTDDSVVVCDIPHTLRYVAAWGGAGNDTLTIGNNFPRDFSAYTDGGPGDDTLNGGPGQDVMLAGESGHDKMYGNAGSDALITESTDGDLLDCGPGDDQMVTNYPCGGHTYKGGPGEDIAGFARSGYNYRIKAQLGGPVANPTAFHGRAYSPGTCGDDPTRWTTIAPGSEILEGTGLNDVLYGDDGPNIIWARDGNDEVRGFGGADVLYGLVGDDEVHGGTGPDILLGGSGYDHIYAADNRADYKISCGTDRGRLESTDPNDPAAAACD